MLPSTGYFKTINCPFYDSGLCERPYCHFKHPRRDDGSTSTVLPIQSVASNEGQAGSNTLQELVSQAVKKVLAGHEGGETGEIPENIVSRVVEELNPTLGSASVSVPHQEMLVVKPVVQPTPCVYNPTPIAELKKRHIPVVPYMPTRDSKVAVKRKTSPERFKPWLSGAQEGVLDNALAAPSYSTVKVTEITYKPTAILTSGGDSAYIQSYVPTIKSDSPSPNSYEDGNSSDYIFKTKEEYRPRSKKRREEYVPKKLKAPLDTVRQLDAPVSVQFSSTDLSSQVEEILNADKCSAGTLGAQEFQDYDMEIEPQFSDEEAQDTTVDKSTKEADKTDPIHARTDKIEEKSKTSHKSSGKSNSNSKSRDNGDSSKHAERRSSLSKDKEKSKEKSDKDKSTKERRSSGTNDHDKDLKDVGNREKSKDKEKHRRSSSSKDKKHSSSSDKDKSSRSSKDRKDSSKHSEKGSEKKTKDSSRTSRGKSEERHKSSSRDKHKSKSSSSSSRDRHSSNKTDRKLSRSSTKSSSSSKKSESRKKSNDEASSAEDHDEKENSPSLRFRSTSPCSEEILEISDSDHDIEEECLKIFQEYEVTEHPKESKRKDQPRKAPEEAEEPGKKRVAHASASQYSELKKVHSEPQKKPVNPQQKLMERWRLRKEAMAEKVAAASAAASASAASQTNSAAQSSQQQQQPSSNSVAKSDQLLNGNGRLRIAHVPYATSLALAKKKVSQAMNKNLENKTIAQTAKGGSRVAHVPQVIPQLIRPEPLQVATQKFPLNVRQYYVNMMQDVCVQIYTNGEDAAQRALREEYACHERCKAVAVYKNSCMLATHRLRKELDQRSAIESGTSCASGTVSHEAVLAGNSKGSWSVVRTKRSMTEFKGTTLYTMLSKWIMTEEQLRENGFPRPHPDGPTGRVKVYVTNTRNQSILSKVPNERFCSRCHQSYMVDKHGNSVVQQNCIYHWGRKFTIRGEGRYSCCQQYGSATGCCDAKTHVWDHVDYENLRGYVQTFPKDNVPVEEQGVYALDCEMSYTTQGLELTRVTVINEDCNVIYETFVKPDHPVIDYNTRFSGITEQNMEGVTTTLLDVQATLLSMFSEKTILIGHSLESDFKALKLLHETVVDTSIMFPHRNGYPQKRALRNLCSEYLQKIIQNDLGGHDSNEDAVSCMELVLWKLKEEAKSQ